MCSHVAMVRHEAGHHNHLLLRRLYVCISQPVFASNTSKCFETLLDLLGWKDDKSGEKSDQMSETVSALGVLFDLKQTEGGTLLVSNTDKRKANVCVVKLRTLWTRRH